MPGLAQFHAKLFGGDVHGRCRALYNAFDEDGTRGLDQPDYHIADLQAVLVLAFFLAQDSFDEQGQLSKVDPVVIIVPKGWADRVTHDLRILAREAFRIRAGDRASVKALRDAFHLLRIGTARNLPANHTRWVALQYSKDSPAPPWVLSAIR